MMIPKYFLFFLFILLFTSCGVSKVSNKNLSGIWTEEWFKSDVNYLDTLKFKHFENIVVIKCLNKNHYIYKNVKLKGGKLNFTLVNKADPKDPFHIDYDADKF